MIKIKKPLNFIFLSPLIAVYYIFLFIAKIISNDLLLFMDMEEMHDYINTNTFSDNLFMLLFLMVYRFFFIVGKILKIFLGLLAIIIIIIIMPFVALSRFRESKN